MYTHTCIRPGCGKQYESEDPDAYYCEPCDEARKAIAAEVDARLGPNVNQPKTPSDFERYIAAPKVRGFANARDIL